MPTKDQIIQDIRAALDKARIDAIYAYATQAFAHHQAALAEIAGECGARVAYLQQQPSLFGGSGASPAAPVPPAPVVLPPPPAPPVGGPRSSDPPENFPGSSGRPAAPPVPPAQTAPQQAVPSDGEPPVFDPMVDLQIAMLQFASAADTLGVPGMSNIVDIGRMAKATPEELWRMADQTLAAVRTHLRNMPTR